jgi:hypothetical protein
MDPGKVTAVARWKQPETLKQVQALLGFANFYRQFFPLSYAAETRPLTDLTRKNEPFVWGCKAPWGLRLECEFVYLTDCEMTGEPCLSQFVKKHGPERWQGAPDQAL